MGTSTSQSIVDKATGKPISYQQGQDLIQQRQLEQIRKEGQQMDERMKYGVNLTYNPIEKTVGPDGKETIGLRKEFQMEGPEKYLEAERTRLGQEQTGAADTLQQQIAQQQAQARANLSTKGGLKGANPMLLQRYSMMDAMKGMQTQGRDFQSMKSELESKGQALGQDIKAKNLSNLMDEVKRIEDFNLNKYKGLQEQLSAKDMAAAIRSGGGGGGGGTSFICTVLRNKGLMTTRESLVMTAFMIKSIFSRANFLVWYFKHGKKIVDKIDASGFDWASVKHIFVDQIIALVKQNKIKEAQELYIKATGELCSKFGDTSFSDKCLTTNLKTPFNFMKLFFIKECQTWLKANIFELPKFFKLKVRC
jgi:hypothetical protein